MLKPLTDLAAYEQAVLAVPHSPFQQSVAWGDFQAKMGHTVRRFSTDRGGVFQVVERTLPAFKQKMWLIPRLPVGVGRTDFEDIKLAAKEAGVLLVRAEPELDISWKRVRSVSPEVSQIVDLRQEETVILAGMHQKTRYNIKLAEKKGVTMRETQDAETWFNLFHQTTARDEFRGHPDDYYREMLNSPLVRCFVTELAGKPLATMLAVFYGDTVTYLHGASSNESRQVMAPHLLQWRVMQEGKKLGFHFYDFWGVNPFQKEHWAYKPAWEGVTEFKRRFGGLTVEYPGTFELGLSPFWYSLYELRRKFRG